MFAPPASRLGGQLPLLPPPPFRRPCQQALASALEYESIMRAAAPGPTHTARKSYVKQTGQQGSEDLLEQILHRLEQLEAQSQPTPPARKPADNGRSLQTFSSLGPCWNCDQMGHIRRYCRKPKRGNTPGESRHSDEPSPNIKVRCLNGMDSVQVAGGINGKSYPVVIDSGANQTIIQRQVIGNRELPPAKEGLCDVTGRCSTLWGPIDVRLRVGHVESTHRVYVSEHLSEPCILGLDYLRKHRCILNIASMTLKVGKMSFLCPMVPRPRANQNPEPSGCRCANQSPCQRALKLWSLANQMVLRSPHQV